MRPLARPPFVLKAQSDSRKSVVLESPVKTKPELLFMKPMLGLTEDSRTTDPECKIVQCGRGELLFTNLDSSNTCMFIVVLSSPI